MLSWDHQVVMPPGGWGNRANQLATLERVAHDLLTQPSFANLLASAEEEVSSELDSLEFHYVRAVRRHYNLAAKIPGELVETLARTVSHSFEAWVRAKRDNQFSVFEPYLKEVFDLTRQVADHRGFAEHPYDALLDEYEPEMLTSDVDRLFAGIKPQLMDLVRRVTASPHQPNRKILQQEFDLAKQKAYAKELLQSIGFSFDHGRLDESAHPFCSSSSYGDVRLTDRFSPSQLTMAIFGALHEGGHGLYEQGSPPEYDQGPLRGGCSLGVHESQSRMWENLVGRSQSFWQGRFRRLQSYFPQQLFGYGADDFFRAINEVRPTLIRVEADEVTYTLHIIMRFEMERDLLTGALAPRDVPELWNAKMKEYLGVVPPTDSQGCLQDIHWADGLIGYFPTYSIGNLIAAQLWRQAAAALPDLQDSIRRGDCSPLLGWLRTQVHIHASRFTPKELIAKVTGGHLDHQPFMEYLESKYSSLYGVQSPGQEIVQR